MAPAGPQKSGVEEARRQKLRPERWLRYFLPRADGWSERYQDLLTGSYDGVDRIVLNGYFRPGHSAGGFRVWWQNLTGSAETWDHTHLMRWAGRFSRRIRGWAKANRVPLIDGRAGERKHNLAEELLKTTPIRPGLFLILVRKAQAPVGEVSGSGTQHHLERKKPMPYVNHYSFPILDPDWGHVTIKISGHPPFPAQIIFNGHEYVACQALKAGISLPRRGMFHLYSGRNRLGEDRGYVVGGIGDRAIAPSL